LRQRGIDLVGVYPDFAGASIRGLGLLQLNEFLLERFSICGRGRRRDRGRDRSRPSQHQYQRHNRNRQSRVADDALRFQDRTSSMYFMVAGMEGGYQSTEVKDPAELGYRYVAKEALLRVRC